MSTASRGRSRLLKAVVGCAVGVGLLVAMVADTTFLDPTEAAAVNPAAFSAEAYVAEVYPEIVSLIRENPTDLAVLVPAYEADPVAAGAEYGTDLGSGKFAYAVSATGTVASVDADFIILTVPGLDGADVRIPLGAALSGTPLRDATGTIVFSDFVDQTQFQSVANQLKITTQNEVLASIDPASLQGGEITVVGAWQTGGPPGTYLIQPVSIEAGP